jgi:hypothetical protein
MVTLAFLPRASRRHLIQVQQLLPGLEEVAMSSARIDQLKVLEGRQVGIALRDGSRIDDCQLISVGRSGVHSMWIFTQGLDVFLPLNDLIDVWEMQPAGARQAA